MRWQDAPLAKQAPRQVREVFAPKVCGAGCERPVFVCGGAAGVRRAGQLFCRQRCHRHMGGHTAHAGATPHVLSLENQTQIALRVFYHGFSTLGPPLLAAPTDEWQPLYTYLLQLRFEVGHACAGLAQHQRAVGRMGRSGHGQQQGRACRPSGARGTGPPATPGGSVCSQPYDAAGGDPCRCVSTA